MDKIEEPAREGFLYQLWINRGFQNVTLCTIDGRAIQIYEKGVRNYDSGPDFKNALLVVDGKMHRGDVEIHPTASDWFAHGHHTDARYNNVILHVVTMNCPDNFKTLRKDGLIIPTLNMDSFMERPAEELESRQGQKVKVDRLNCALSRLEESRINTILQRCGDARLEIKRNRMSEQRQTQGWDQIFYAEILAALGYSKNQIPFRLLANTLPIETIWRYIWKDPRDLALRKSEAYLFGAAGLLPSQCGLAVPGHSFSAAYCDDLERHWREFPERRKLDPIKSEAWQFFRLRPQNFPTRRIAAAAVLCARFLEGGFIDQCLKVLHTRQNKFLKNIRELEKMFIVDAVGFWITHYSFDSNIQDSASEVTVHKIIGRDRAAEISLNVVVPVVYAYAAEIHDGKLAALVKEMYAQYPKLKENEITRAMRRKLFSDRRTSIFSARHQQGMIHLAKSCCETGPCQACISL